MTVHFAAGCAVLPGLQVLVVQSLRGAQPLGWVCVQKRLEERPGATGQPRDLLLQLVPALTPCRLQTTANLGYSS